MKLTTRSIKHFLVVTAVMIFSLLLINGIGLNVALAQGAIEVDTDCPAVLRALNGCQGGLRGIVLSIVNFFLGFLGLLAVIMVIYGGFLYVSSAGNEENVNKAKKILLYAVLGIVVIIVSFALINTILGAAAGERGA